MLNNYMHMASSVGACLQLKVVYECIACSIAYGDFGTRSGYLGNSPMISLQRIVCGAITYPCPIYLLSTPKSLFMHSDVPYGSLRYMYYHCRNIYFKFNVHKPFSGKRVLKQIIGWICHMCHYTRSGWKWNNAEIWMLHVLTYNRGKHNLTYIGYSIFAFFR